MCKNIQFQQSFTESGQLETPDSVESTLGHHGIDIDTQTKESQPDRPKATEFGADDRHLDSETDPGEQVGLFPDCEDDQLDLTGEKAGNKSRFEEGSR